MRLLLVLALAVGAAHAQPTVPTRVTVQLSGGVADLALGDADAFHELVAESYRRGGVAIPTQRSLGTAPVLGVDVLWPFRQSGRIGVGVRAAETSAYSLYGDFAGTLDLVSRVQAVFVETVGHVELGQAGPVRPTLGARVGAVWAQSSLDERLVFEGGSGLDQRLESDGVGLSAEGTAGLAMGLGPLDVFVRGGLRAARVGSLQGEFFREGEVFEGANAPYTLSLSGWSGTVGVTFRP